MIRYLIKNNFKLMLRNKWVMLVMIFAPILVVSILSSAFGSMMETYEQSDSFTVGFRIDNDSIPDSSIEQVKEAGNKLNIKFTEYPEGDPEDLISKNNLSGFAIFESDKYTIYQSDDSKIEGMTLEYFVSQMMNEVSAGIIGTISPELSYEPVILPIEEVEFMPAINAKNYYGIVYIVYFIWCGIVCMAGVLTSEKKNGIEKKFTITKISGLKLFCAKLIPAVITTTVEITASIVAITLLFDIHWGNIPMTILILFLTVIASSTFSLMVYYIARNIAITIIIIFSSVWFLGFIGGAFEIYMFSAWDESLKLMSPLYNINRTLIEYSCMGDSSFTGGCIIYLLIIIFACTVISLITDTFRRRIKE